MKRTIEVDAPLMAEAERVAAAHNTTVDALLRDALLRVIADCEGSERASNGYELPDRSVGGDGPTPEWESAPWDEKLRLIYGDRG
jgi:hypothetical protein